jgi:hypothetical protein
VSWRLEGEFFENCNCDVLCPCITGADLVPADYERCLVPMVCRVEAGELDEVSLDRLCFVYVLDTPPVMGRGDWRMAIYIDERGDETQRDALRRILLGELGGPPEAMATLVGEHLGVRYVPIEFRLDGRRRGATIPGILDIEVEGQSVPGWNRVYEIANVFHPMGDVLPIARALRGRFTDPELGLDFDNAGQNAHYCRFSWNG